MDSKQILSSDLLDIIFDQRNKTYGAYELRRHYNRRIARALLVTATLVGITITSVTLANKWKPKKEFADIIDNSVKITQIEDDPIIPDPPPEIPPATQPEQVRTEQFSTLRIVPEDQVTDPPPAMADLDSAMIGLKKEDGIAVDEGISPAPQGTIDGDKGIIATPEPKDEGPRMEVQVQAKFIGNWEKFLLRHLNGNIPVDNGANPGRYQVMVQFVVDVDGSVSDIKPLTNVGFGMEQEAIRVLKKATKWEPAMQNGRQVKAYRRQPITFQVDGE
ncbi:MAG: energy transducer TonB [Chitinophagaceae bacterium]